MAGKIFNVGVVGYGLSAKVFHIPFIFTTPQFRLHSIVQRTPKDNDSAPKDHPDAKHYNDWQSLVADPEVDVVTVTTPPDNHFELTKAALEAGKHVMTEKPFVPTSAEAEKLVEISRATGKLLCVYQNRRWDTDFLLVKHLVETKALGRIFEFNTHFDRYKADTPPTWKGQLGIPQGGSPLFDLGTHLIDQVYTLYGLPKAVQARVLSQREGKPDYVNPDAVSAQLVYDDGLFANVNISSLSAETEQNRFWIRGTKGSFRKSGLDPQEDALRGGGKPTDAGFGKEDLSRMRLTLVGEDGSIKEGKIPQLEPETYIKFYAAWGKAVESGKEEDVPVKASQAKEVLRIIEAAVESAKSGKDVPLA